MLTDLSFLEKGEEFPPVCEKTRLDEYRKNDILFHSGIPPEWSRDFSAIARRLGKRQSEIDTIFNYQQLISKKTADFICGEPPTIETEQNTDKIIKKLENQDFFMKLTDVEEGDESKRELDIESLEVFENIAYIMAKHADPENVPDSPDDFLEQFNTFSIYEILPQLIELWGLNTATQVESKKNIARLTDR